MTEQARSNQFVTLRKRAEEELLERPVEVPASLDELSSGEVRRLFHELKVHQTELEMQNDELRRAQQELEASRYGFVDLYDFAPVGYFTLSEQGVILEANLTITSLLGVERANLIEIPLSHFIAREDQDIYYLLRRQLFETQEPQVCELRMTRKDGSQFWARIETVIAKGSESQAVCRAAVSDISEQVRAEAALAEQTRALRQLNQNLVMLNRLGQEFTATLDLQQVAEQLLRAATEIIGAEGASIWLWDVREPTRLNSSQAQFNGEEQQGWLVCQAVFQHNQSRSLVNLRLRPGQGVAGWVAQNGESVVISCAPDDPRFSPEIDAQTGFHTYSLLAVPLRARDAVIGVLEVVNKLHGDFDADDRALVETLVTSASIAAENARLHQELQGHAEQLEEQVQKRTAEIQAQYAFLEAILHSATDGIVVADEQGEITQTNPVAQTWLTHTLSPKDAGRLREAVRDVVRQTSAKIAVERRPGVLLELAGLDLTLSAAPLSGPGIERMVAVVAIHDVSELKAMDRMKTGFITNISHELRTPITTIKLYAHLMRQQPEKWKEYLDVLTREAEHQIRLVEGILEIARLDARRLEMEPQPTPLDELTALVFANHQMMAQKQGLTLEHRPMGALGAEPGPIALADPARVMQVLNNLVDNGIRYTLEGGTVTISTGREEAEGRAWATITVADTGMGIPESELPHIFDRFFRGAEPLEMQLTGTGLGLSIVQEIVKLHGGRVTVESEKGVGSTFTVWLPVGD